MVAKTTLKFFSILLLAVLVTGCPSQKDAFNNGYQQGYHEGYNTGYRGGKEDGIAEGRTQAGIVGGIIILILSTSGGVILYRRDQSHKENLRASARREERASDDLRTALRTNQKLQGELVSTQSTILRLTDALNVLHSRSGNAHRTNGSIRINENIH